MPESSSGLEGKVAIVTGGGGGIGRGIVERFAAEGAAVVFAEIDADRARATQVAAGDRVVGVVCDVREPDAADALVVAARDNFGRIDILVNNAGTAIRADSISYSEADFAEVVDVNLRAAFFASQAAARHMLAADGGRIINLSSVFAHAAMPQRAVYAATKAGLEQMTAILAVEWAPRILVNAVAPATIMTPTRAHLFPTPEALAERVRLIPVGRLGVPDDVAPAVLFLASRAADFITGATMLVDGGMSLGPAPLSR
jgi:NAD(P)-dependent dehydrogenase (short-subunit alcohol dehydrogenase family)